MAKTSPAEFFNQVRAEGRKVVWPSREETTRTAIFVGILMVILAIFFLGIDTLFGVAVQWHPEENAADRRLFAGLVEAARTHRTRRIPA